ncbi:hypothetical protein BDK51DRAFT_50334 [Blyttiomyces helicus]|uniref:Uncharacterized protein n=1 Tax=Blyttiomyces helicus TaxID=388810 RepID=A0A4P9W6I5_9FUNG|nr:hypothetical protein BDK51DRAFT_50334 [Blyttiomyces helicus]|eukprot:RKO86548.1 hypothetical protein BDK51DRAFT_50334 [Blyttiomyces helicus]
MIMTRLATTTVNSPPFPAFLTDYDQTPEVGVVFSGTSRARKSPPILPESGSLRAPELRTFLSKSDLPQLHPRASSLPGPPLALFYHAAQNVAPVGLNRSEGLDRPQGAERRGKLALRMVDRALLCGMFGSCGGGSTTCDGMSRSLGAPPLMVLRQLKGTQDGKLPGSNDAPWAAMTGKESGSDIQDDEIDPVLTLVMWRFGPEELVQDLIDESDDGVALIVEAQRQGDFLSTHLHTSSPVSFRAHNLMHLSPIGEKGS